MSIIPSLRANSKKARFDLKRAFSGLSDSIDVDSELSLVFVLFRVELVIRDVKIEKILARLYIHVHNSGHRNQSWTFKLGLTFGRHN